jgi:phosphopantothenoylcysteine decarboxylase
VKVEVVATKTSLQFYDRKQVEAAGSRVWLDEDEWTVGFLSIKIRFIVLTV